MTTPSPTGTYNWIDPTIIPQAGDFLIVLVDDRRGFLGWFIKAHESGNYNHAMVMRKVGLLDSQANVFKEIPATSYMQGSSFLKFWRVKNIDDVDLDILNKFIDKELAKPWYQKFYDILGLFGQALPFLHWIQIPGLYFCSEIVATMLRLLPMFSYVPKEPSPSDIDRLFKQHPEDIEVLGYWFSD